MPHDADDGTRGLEVDARRTSCRPGACPGRRTSAARRHASRTPVRVEHAFARLGTGRRDDFPQQLSISVTSTGGGRRRRAGTGHRPIGPPRTMTPWRSATGARRAATSPGSTSSRRAAPGPSTTTRRAASWSSRTRRCSSEIGRGGHVPLVRAVGPGGAVAGPIGAERAERAPTGRRAAPRRHRARLRRGRGRRPDAPAAAQPRASLKPYLRFQKLPPAALGPVRRAVESDEEFRQRVAAVATEELVGRPGWLWLHRPDGWEDELATVLDADAAEATAAADAPRRPGRRQTGRRRRGGRPAGHRRAGGGPGRAGRGRSTGAGSWRPGGPASTARVAQLEIELGGARRRLAAGRARRRRRRPSVWPRPTERAGDAEARLAVVEARLDRGRGPRPGRGSGPGARPPGRRGPAGGRPTPPTDTAPAARDDDRLTAALRDAAAATERLGEALRRRGRCHRPGSGPPRAGAAPATPRPRRPRRTPLPLPGGVFADTVQAATHLVRQPGVTLVVDGYNAAKLGWPDETLPLQRERLLDVLEELVARHGTAVHVVFDGADVPVAPLRRRRRMHVEFSPARRPGRRRDRRPGIGRPRRPPSGRRHQRQRGAHGRPSGWCQRHLVAAVAGRRPPMTMGDADELIAAGREAGLDAVGVAPAEPFAATRRHLEERKAAGLHAGMAFTYRNPARSTDPGARRRRGARPSSSGARRTRRRRAATRPAGPAGRVARYAWSDHYDRLRDGLRARRRPPAGRRLARRRRRRRQHPRRPRGRLPGRPRLVRQERQPAAARAGARGSCSARSSPTRPLAPTRGAGAPTAAARAAAASTAARPAPSSPPAWSTPAAAWRGWCSSRARSRSSTARPSATASTAATTARRCARPTGRAAAPRRPAARPATANGAAGVGAAARPAGGRPTTSSWPATAAGTSPAATPAGCAATPWSRSATSPTARTRPWPRCWSRPSRPDSMLGRTPSGLLRRPHDGFVPAAARLGQLRRCSAIGRPRPAATAEPDAARAVKHLLVTNDFPPKVGGIQSYLWELWRRLPADDFAVLTTPYDGADRVRPAAALPRRAQPRAPCCCRRPRCGGASTAWPTRPAPSWSCSTRRCPLGLLGPSLRHPYAVVLHGAEVTVPGRAARRPGAARPGAAPGPSS